ncbi:glucans biosynthesis glucosyltransferase MdoH [Acetobacter pasteurianus]|uniref:Glucans biosynthesis glucosyltransferase H n=1 Tax=Acetobacter pasteurianus NBRC 3188 TaxID=1226663 RepID=A0A401WY37_ACEPA|nr:glucans biosynthesis glucosyltransferase MdoH [Acetobacter pasteurianus]GCD54258.1 glucosyltransferase MdoH [Acetobacter pasteurianus NBRC 3188]
MNASKADHLDAYPYLALSGLSPAEAHKEQERIQSWEDLSEWLDNNTPPDNTPPPDRTPIGTPIMETSWKAALRRRFFDLQAQGDKHVGEDPVWPKVVERRRRVTTLVSLALTALMTALSSMMISVQTSSTLLVDILITLMAIMNFFMINVFAKLMIGTWHAIRGAKGNPWHPAHTACNPRSDAKVAILFPVYHEDPHRVVGGMIAVATSLLENVEAAGAHYEFFLLSDSRKPSYRIAELAALEQARQACPKIKFHYRWRTTNENAKLGNVTDFCRRWGKIYDYMLVMDADSIMNGKTIHTLLRMMEGNHRLGILQTNPTPVMRESLFGRMQQFAGGRYGSAFSYALQAMHMGHASYIGHNAMIRTQAFMENCLLPDLPGKKPWGGKPLSHDIIEAALMARAGYEVWFLPDIGGSYEEIPANIIGFMARERRWMQGNLQHTRFLFIDGLKKIHRENFVTGFMGYLSAPIWGIFLLISAPTMVSFIQSGKFSNEDIGKIEVPSIIMLIASIVFMFAPRILALILCIKQKKTASCGGTVKLITSMALETIFTFFFAPLMMAFISKFVWLWAKRKSISWGTQQRDDEALSWSTCIKCFSWTTAIGIVCTIALYAEIQKVPAQSAALLSMASGHLLEPMSLFLWFFPILGGLSGSIIIARFTSRTFPILKKMKIFSIPEEIDPPEEIKNTLIWTKELQLRVPDPENEVECFLYALKDKSFYLAQRARCRIKTHISAKIKQKLSKGEKLSLKEFMFALNEKACLDLLHQSHCEKHNA